MCIASSENVHTLCRQCAHIPYVTVGAERVRESAAPLGVLSDRRSATPGTDAQSVRIARHEGGIAHKPHIASDPAESYFPRLAGVQTV